MRRNRACNKNPVADSKNIILGETYRITVLTEGLVRLEYQEDGRFEDRPSQMVQNRDFPPSAYRVVRRGQGLEIITPRMHMIYNEERFSRHGLSIQVTGNFSAYHSIWHYFDDFHDLKGTARTLDETDGAVELEHGLISRFGYSVIDDGRSMIMTEDGWIKPRREGGGEDIYFFGYGHDYLKCLNDFYHLCGRPPMLPRYALGNWWSRFYRYTEQSYMELMERFAKEEIPFTVAVIDMDWHLVDIDPKHGSGWTGYTWNKELFPDPERFLGRLHKMGLRTTLNIHPAEGVRAHEDVYEEMAAELGVDYENGDPINFDITSREFLEACFTHIHHPYEAMGVDFWWLDWQQGGGSRIPGVDPLWMLNHYYYMDSGREGKRPMTFSRYAGPGSHRYPVGFSGDTVTTWESLDFQPYFTANASNIGYGWWSNDIGGHMRGYKNDEMTARWTQFGVFSPIMRLHSSCSIFNGKEPWRYNGETRAVMGTYLRLRHQMMPYLYTMNYRSWAEGKPLMMPMYYHNPESEQAYNVPNQYYFGSELIVSAVTRPRIARLNVAKVRVWLPDGIYVDMFTHMLYEGGRTIDMYRPLEQIPVLAKAGGILPMTDHIGAPAVTGNPKCLHIRIFAGADGSFTLYEDDNETCAYEKGDCVTTKMNFNWTGGKQSFTIGQAVGNTGLIGTMRSYTLEFVACGDAKCHVVSGDLAVTVMKTYDGKTRTLTIKIPETPTESGLKVVFNTWLQVAPNPVAEQVYRFLNQAEIEFDWKEILYAKAVSGQNPALVLSEIQAMDIESDLKGVLAELLTADIGSGMTNRYSVNGTVPVYTTD